MKDLAGSYEALFSRKAQLYKARGLKDQKLTEDDYKNLILEHYTFLSRPVFLIGGKIYVGNSAKNVEKVVETLK
jgi:arsenate reductase